MRASTIGILLFVFGFFSLMSGFDWLAIVFFAIGLAMMFLYKEAVEVPREYQEASHVQQAFPPQQQPIVIVEQGGGHEGFPEKIQEHIMLERALGHPREHEEIEKKAHAAHKHVKKLKRHIEELEKELVKRKALKGKKKHETEW